MPERMAKRVTITLDDDVLLFVDRHALLTGAKANRSCFINQVLANERSRCLEKELTEAYQKDAVDSKWRQEAAAWDSVAADGISA